MEEVTRVKMAKFRHDLHSQIRQVMKKYIVIEEEVLVRLVEGKCVGGSLCRDKWTGVIMFKAYNRQPRKREKDQLVKKLPWVAVGLGEGIGEEAEGVRQFPQGHGNSPCDGTGGRACPRGEECADRP